ncbi:MAG TPA: M20 family metallopeptidase [Bacillota bacterium]
MGEHAALGDVQAALREHIRSRRAQIVADLEQAIRLRSENPPGNEGPVAEFLAARLRELGVEPVFQEMAPGRPNLIATFDFSALAPPERSTAGTGAGAGPTAAADAQAGEAAARRPSLLLTTHMDVVPAGGGQRDLFAPAVEGDRLYGRGACDAKGSLVAMLAACEALVALARSSRPPAGRLLFAAVAAEESGGHGTKHLVAQGIRADYAIVGEPTSLRVALGHKGSYRRRVVFTGRAAHSSDPSRGVNAIYRAARFALAVERWHTELQRVSDPLFGSGAASANVIAGGVKVIVIPDRCAVEIDRRLLPGETTAQAEAELLEILEGLRAGDPTLTWTIEDLGMDKEPAAVDREAAVVRALRAAARQVVGRDEVEAFRGGTDMTFLAAAGIKTAILGPGSIDQAHTADEFVPIEELWQAAAIYALAAWELLGGQR